MLAATSRSALNEPRKRKRKSTHGFPGVRGGQGRGRDKYQACLPGKEKRGPLFDTPEEAAEDYLRLEREKERESMMKLPDYAAAGGRSVAGGAFISPLPTLRRVLPMAMPCVSIGRSMWPLPVGSNPNSHGCEVVVAQLRLPCA